MPVQILRAAILSVGMLIPAYNANAMIISLNDIGGAAPGTLAGNAFLEAASFWTSFLVDPIVVNLNVGFQALNASPNTLGQTVSTTQNHTYTTIKNALIADQTTIDDQTVVQHLQTTASLKFLSNNPQGTIALDANNSANNTYLSVNTALLKALDLMPNNSISDASITFNSLFSFDFDSSNGISSGNFDFVGIAIHEIGHALGFVSGVDIVDTYSGSGPNANQVSSFDNFVIYTVLDLFRFSDTSLNSGLGIQDLAIRSRGQYFSIDGGQTELASFSTGRYNGDGRQASHWRDNSGLGIMDPTFSAGQIGEVTAQDLLAFDAIGYDLAFPVSVSLPSGLALFTLGLSLLYFRKRWS